MDPHTFNTHRPLLEALAYRMLGSAAEAEDVVQDSFVRALSHPPGNDRPVRPWLVRVTCNLARDRLRKRKVRAYRGPWLPEPVADPPTDSTLDPETRLRLAQTATLAWLVAAETLTPEQRAVVLLREVFEWTVPEAGAALNRSAGAIRSLHLRARRALAGSHVPTPDAATFEAHQRALYALLDAVNRGDVDGVGRMLSDDVELWNDGGDEVHAVGKRLEGVARVARVTVAVAQASGAATQVWDGSVNGMPALIVHTPPHRAPRWPTVSLTAVVLGPSGRIRRIFNVVAPSKLTRTAHGFQRVEHGAS